MLLSSENTCALILEDDLIWRHISDLHTVLNKIESIMSTAKPLITLLSGDYWFTSRADLVGQYRLASVRDAVCTQSYVINRATAQIMLGQKKVTRDRQHIFHSPIRSKLVFT